MFKLIYYQFKYSKKQWLGMFPLFFASSLLVGMCLSVAFSTIKYQQVFRDVGSPTLLFVGPVLFGGFTIFEFSKRGLSPMVNKWRKSSSVVVID